MSECSPVIRQEKKGGEKIFEEIMTTQFFQKPYEIQD